MNVFNRWKDKASNYIDVRLGLLKLSLIERTSNVIGHLLISFIYIFLTLSALSFIGYGLMETFSVWFDSRVAGSFATAGLFVLLLLVIFMLRKAIITSFAGIFIRVLTEGDEDDEEEEKERRNIKVED